MSRIAEASSPAVYGYPETPGFKEKGGTSEDAATGIETKSGRLRLKVLASIRQRPSTADEVAAHLGEPIWNVRPRVTELGRQGKIVKTRERRRNESGASAWVWREVPTCWENR